MRTALTVAGSDSGGGAGIQADLKSFAALGVHGASVVTCITAQNTRGVSSIFPIPTEEIRAQLRAVLSDFDVRAAKTGMLYSGEIVRTVANEMRRHKFPLVVDPVMVATVGASLHAADFRDALVDDLVPRADLVTPNAFEAEQLSGRAVRTPADAKVAARAIAKFGARAVLVKGGHLRGPVVDLLYRDGEFLEFRSPRYPADLHGSGCTLAASIAGALALGDGLDDAVALGRRRVMAGFATAYRPGRGIPVINSHFTPDRYAIWESVTQAADRATRLIPVEDAPEVGINLGYALPAAAGPEEVCALRGRIVRVGEGLAVTGPAAFGASRHIARVILTAMASDPSVRCAINLKYRGQNVTRLRGMGFTVATFRRTTQPEGISTMEWGTRTAIESAGRVPDVIWDSGGIGKEAMMRVLGSDPRDVLRKVGKIVGR